MKTPAVRTVPTVLAAAVFLAAGSVPAGPVPAGPARGTDLAALRQGRIVVSKDTPASTRYAAGEFQHFFEKATGSRLPIAAEDGAGGSIYIGPSEALESSSLACSREGLGPEDLRIVIREGHVAILGGGPRGTLYGVYTFLEDYLGVRFLTADHTHVPPCGDWRVVGPVARSYHPPFAMRWSYYGEVNRNPRFAARLRVNTVPSDPELGGRTGMTNINHSFFRQIPSQKYGREHPEYYSLVDGKRLADVENDAYGNQPCLTHPDVLRIVTEAVLREIEAHPENANVSVSQNDNAKYCRCERCAAIDAREGTPMGSLLTFVNAVADRVAKEHPDIQVGTLSYWYSRKPPRTIRPRPNVQIQLCSIECCLIHPIADPECPRNVDFCGDMRRWGEICDNISIWNYNTNFTNYLLPCPNLRVIEPNVRFFVANRAKGVFMQAAGNARAAELSELRNYMIANLLWDPNRSGERLMEEFLHLHYGKAAPPIRRYIDLIHDAAEASGVHRNCFAPGAKDYGLGDELAPRALELFREALELAEAPKVVARIEKASIAAYRLAIEPVWNTDPEKLSPELRETMRPLVHRFLELCAEYKVDRARERTEFAAVRERLRKL